MPQRELDDFLGFDWTEEATPRRGRAVYAIYRTLNGRRHGHLQTDDLQGAFRIAMGEAAQAQGEPAVVAS